MNASYEWLRELVPVSATPAELADLLTARCASVDEIVRIRKDLEDIIVARVVRAGRHPNADTLWVTKVDAGQDELLDVVCGAPNVREGALYPFARAGTTIPGGIRLEKRKIRGEISNGMLCSARELQLGSDHAGILELDVDVPPGTPLLQALPLGDARIVVDVTPNRPDLLSHVGLAREIAAATGVSLRDAYRASDRSLTPIRSAHEGYCGSVAVRLEDSAGCLRYVGAVIRDVEVKDSPEWLRRRLEAIGQRSVNNIVDVTNLLLHECGQPMHAFDLDALGGSAVVIRKARAGEVLETLDGIRRTLATSMTVIADAHRAQAVAGVMGGADSAVANNTRNVFLEIANFEPASVRATRMALGLSTDASYRFERGVDPELPAVSLARAVQLIIEVAGGHMDGEPVDLYPAPRSAVRISLRLPRAVRVLGVPLTLHEVASLLQPVGFGVASVDGGKQGVVEVTVPTWRVDVEAEIDLIEEVARLRGYDSFPDEIRAYRPGAVPDDPMHHVEARMRAVLVSAGLLEARPMPFVKGTDATHVAVANPIAEDERHLRMSLLETLARRAEYNLARMQRNVRLFEIGNAFALSGSRLPVEDRCVAAIAMGPRRPPHFTEPDPPSFDEWDAKGLAELIANGAFPESQIALVPAAADPATLWWIEVDGAQRGRVVRVSLDAPVWAPPAFGVELSLGTVASADVAAEGEHSYGGMLASGGAVPVSGTDRPGKLYRPIPEYPAADFDVALIVPDSVPAQHVEELLRRTGGELLESLSLFDEFRGQGIPAGARSLAWRLTFRHPERTLRDKEVEGRRQKLLTALEKELGVRQRSS